MTLYSAGEIVVREYTPIVSIFNRNDQNHHLLLMVKIYSNGKMTQYLSTIQTGKYSWQGNIRNTWTVSLTFDDIIPIPPSVSV